MRISDWSSDVCSSDLNSLDAVNSPCRFSHVGVARITQEYSSQERGAAAAERNAAERSIAELEIKLTEIGRASCRERVCQYVSISVVAVTLKKTNTYETIRDLLTI